MTKYIMSEQVKRLLKTPSDRYDGNGYTASRRYVRAQNYDYYRQAYLSGGLVIVPGKSETTQRSSCSLCGERIEKGSIRRWCTFDNNSHWARFDAKCWRAITRVTK